MIKLIRLFVAVLSIQQQALAFQNPSSLGRSAIAVSNKRIIPSNYRTSKSTAKFSAASGESAEQNESESTPLFESIGKGLIRDTKARLPFLKSDFTDGMNVQCLAAVMFLFFACLAPAVGFGGLFDTVTNGAMGTMEMVSSTAICGVIYALFSAQPLTIIGSTGPVLAFVAALAQLAKKTNLPFLPLYSWTGLWTAGILFVTSLTSGSNVVKYLTRFTDDIFSVLISAIFIVQAVSDVGGSFATTTLTKALLTLVLSTGTYFIANTLKGLRKTELFTKRVRNTLSNFGPTIGVVTSCLFARWARLAHGIEAAGLPALSLPATFATTSGRPWLVPLGQLPVWARWGAFIPALMATVLLFLDQNITVRLVNNPQYKMKKGRREGNLLDGMHVDMMVISLLTVFQSLVGFPWLVAATVRSVTHVRALSEYDDKGERSATKEQRITGTAIHALIGACVLFAQPRQLLTQISLPVLMGLFLYLGVSSLPGNEMWERILEIFKDPSVAVKQRWTGKVPVKVSKLFTFIQLGCLGAMFWVKDSPIGVLFPVVIAMLAPLRFGLEKFGIISKKDMDVLDAE